ncbi:MAG TPA: GNAT family N-acetyltransferase [Steroidobacteraceae bacterium]|nr:GNAT family N-acetyltransferase [Steroidobacteraceae bacterium]
MQDDKLRDAEYRLVEGSEPHHYEMAGVLFREYAGQLGVDLCFQNFDSELNQLPVMYGKPGGCLLLVMRGARPVGCGALRKLSARVCEMKRLYIRNEARRLNLGRRVAERLVERAAALGYEAIRLDTLDHMAAARNLYRSLGFREIAAYYDNPLANSVYMELPLAPAAPAAPGS